MVALIPDLSYMLMQKIFFPTPTDGVLLLQNRQPNYIFTGFDEVFRYELPDDPAPKRTIAAKDNFVSTVGIDRSETLKRKSTMKRSSTRSRIEPTPARPALIDFTNV